MSAMNLQVPISTHSCIRLNCRVWMSTAWYGDVWSYSTRRVGP